MFPLVICLELNVLGLIWGSDAYKCSCLRRPGAGVSTCPFLEIVISGLFKVCRLQEFLSPASRRRRFHKSQLKFHCPGCASAFQILDLMGIGVMPARVPISGVPASVFPHFVVCKSLSLVCFWSDALRSSCLRHPGVGVSKCQMLEIIVLGAW